MDAHGSMAMHGSIVDDPTHPIPHNLGMMTECDGSVSYDRKGSWMGHVLPGIVFCIWGTYMLLQVSRMWLWRSARKPYRALAWYPMDTHYLRYFEPIIKIILPPIAVSIELYWDHPSYRYLYCPEGTKFAGRFAMTHMNNWQHTSTYPAFVLAGIIDLLGNLVELPPFMGHGALAIAFGVAAFMMGTHEKHDPMDKMGHWLLYVAMLLCLIFIIAEIAAPSKPILGFGKALAFIFHGAWLIQLGRMEFERHPQWSEAYSGGADLAPFAFCMIGVTIAFCATAFFALLSFLRDRHLVYLPLAETSDDSKCLEGRYSPMGLVPMVLEDNADLFSDSARHSSGEASPLKRSVAYSGKHKLAQLELSARHDFASHAV